MNIKQEYREVLAGFEKHSFSDEQLERVRNQLAMAAHDLNACKHCNGVCMTTINHKCRNQYYHIEKKTAKCDENCYIGDFNGFYGLHHAGCRMYGEPCFAVIECPGPGLRKKDIVNSMTAKQHDWQDRKDAV